MRVEQYRSYALGSQPKWISSYISSMSFDLYICDYVIDVLKAHVIELGESGNLSTKVVSKLLEVLEDFDCTEVRGTYEDIHEAIEYHVSKRTAEGKWLNLGKSRNDQVATALRMRVREEMLDLMDSLIVLLKEMVTKAAAYTDVPFPAFTHFQPAQPTTFGHYLLNFAEEIIDITSIIFGAYEFIDKCPMGSAAVAGSTVPVNRSRICEKLCFKDLAMNTIYATTSREFMVASLQVLQLLSLVLWRFLEDMFLFSNPMVGLVEVPSSHAGTSSIMPHKRNPATLEIARAELAKVNSVLQEFMLTLKGLPSGYCLDLQQLSPSLWEAFRRFRRTVIVIADFVREVEVGKGVERAFSYPLRAADVAEYLSMKKGIPFREAYKRVALAVKEHGYDMDAIERSVLGEERLEDPIASRRNLGSPGNWRPILNKVLNGIEELVKFVSNEWSRIGRCYDSLK
ncbi:argininosuccinate lyase [Ignicoccus pacificus DSM 13166]|uniref:Argininosuccinate lyase n=1 Tax=Ignicoccus pacificus DSM 13166 TaxID=940294 RepID=A0A977KA54_9CREN|nr:argininosuccinate lyase [Ignicoccus pacificus DSM 13166]